MDGVDWGGDRDGPCEIESVRFNAGGNCCVREFPPDLSPRFDRVFWTLCVRGVASEVGPGLASSDLVPSGDGSPSILTSGMPGCGGTSSGMGGIEAGGSSDFT